MHSEFFVFFSMRSIKCILILLFWFVGVHARDAEIAEYYHFRLKPLFVSLGSHCEVAVKLRENLFRNIAFPFDWLLTFNHEKLIELLDHNFQHFFDEQYFFRHPIHQHIVENNYYEIEFRHDWPFTDLFSDSLRYQQQMQEIKSKYERRIERFKKLRDYSGKVFFIRAAYDFYNDPDPYWKRENINKQSAGQARELKNALDRFFPSLDFTLVIVNYQDEHAQAIEGIENVLEFKIRKTHKPEDYKAMFDRLLQYH